MSDHIEILSWVRMMASLGNMSRGTFGQLVWSLLILLIDRRFGIT